MKFTNFRCPMCKKVFTAGQWNVQTLAHCTEHKKVRMRTKIQDSGCTAILSYQCPSCLVISRKSLIAPVLKSEVTTNE